MSRLSHSTTWTVWRAAEGHVVVVPDSTQIPREANLHGFGLWVQDAVELATALRDNQCQTT